MTWRAARLPAHRGPAGWAAVLPGAPDFPPLEEDATADVAIVGAGFAGLSAARRLLLAEPGLKVVVLEAGRVAEGAAGRNSGFMIDLPHELTSADYAGQGDRDRRLIALNREAIAFARAMVRQFAIPEAFFDPCGKVNGAASEAAEAANRSYAAHLERLGERSERLDAADMAALTGSRHYRSGLYTPGTVQIQPAGYVRGIAAGLAGQGLTIHETSPVTEIVPLGKGWRLSTPRAGLSAGTVILAVNGHLESFGIMRRRLMHIILFATMTRALDPEELARLGGQPRWGITPSDPMGTTLRRIDAAQGGPRIVTRTCAAFRPDMEAPARALARAERVMRAKFDARFPELAGVPFEFAWAGHLCLTRNGVSVAREIAPGVYTACAQNGLGTTRGTLTGIAAAERALGIESDVTRFFETEPEPEKLPPEPIASLGANALIRWREWRARAE